MYAGYILNRFGTILYCITTGTAIIIIYQINYVTFRLNRNDDDDDAGICNSPKTFV